MLKKILGRFRYHLKVCRIVVHIFNACLICVLIFPWSSKKIKERRIQRWSRQLLEILGVSVSMNVAQVPPKVVVVSNHISWLDIFVINSFSPCRFVAKAAIGDWPLMGWIARHAGAIYISRESKSDLKRIYRYLVEQIEAGERIAFFPEGTVADQGKVLPFHANLFEAAIHAKAPIQPIALRYLNADGALHPAVSFTSDIPFGKSIVNVLNGGKITVELNGLAFIPSEGAHRRELAAVVRQAVATALQVEIQQ